MLFIVKFQHIKARGNFHTDYVFMTRICGYAAAKTGFVYRVGVFDLRDVDS